MTALRPARAAGPRRASGREGRSGEFAHRRPKSLDEAVGIVFGEGGGHQHHVVERCKQVSPVEESEVDGALDRV